MASDKAEIRKKMLARRRGLAAHEVESASASLCKRLDRFEKITGASSVVAYYPFHNEISPFGYLEKILVRGGAVFLPRFEQETGYVFCRVESLSAGLVKGKFGIAEPPEAAPIATEGELSESVWLVPGVAFDLAGNRLGRGGGYYDRFLTGSTQSVALAYSWQLLPELPVEKHDRPVRHLVTEDAEYSFI